MAKTVFPNIRRVKVRKEKPDLSDLMVVLQFSTSLQCTALIVADRHNWE